MQYVDITTQGPVSIVTLNRPERLNAIGSGLLVDLHQALVVAQTDPATRVIVFTGAGRAFCAGDDLKEFDAQAATMAEHADRIQQITRDIMFGDKLVIGAVHGYAVGGGFEWMLNCDLVVAADDLVCFFPEMALGHFVTGAVTHLLPLALGHQRAMELLVLGRRHDAAALHALGLVNRVVPAAQRLAASLELANEVAQRSPRSIACLKRALTTQLGGQLERALEVERAAAIDGFADADTARRVRQFVKHSL
jgi:enoyl-CoA hydratase/carnithine racemase